MRRLVIASITYYCTSSKVDLLADLTYCCTETDLRNVPISLDVVATLLVVAFHCQCWWRKVIDNNCLWSGRVGAVGPQSRLVKLCRRSRRRKWYSLTKRQMNGKALSLHGLNQTSSRKTDRFACIYHMFYFAMLSRQSEDCVEEGSYFIAKCTCLEHSSW